MSKATVLMDADEVRRAGFVVAGEPLAVDLANTVKYAASPPRDLLAQGERNRSFWALESRRLPVVAAIPSLVASQELRSAIRSLLDSRLANTEPEEWAISRVNEVAGSVTTSTRLRATREGFAAELVWHDDDASDIALAAVARSAIDLLSGPDSIRLRQCAADDCSMFFVATNAKRRWCTSSGCGNRHRVARFANKDRGGLAQQPPADSLHLAND